jgi:hypothetical protein
VYIYEMDSLMEVTYNSTEIILQMPMLQVSNWLSSPRSADRSLIFPSLSQPTNSSVTFQYVPCIELLTIGDIIGLVIGGAALSF